MHRDLVTADLENLPVPCRSARPGPKKRCVEIKSSCLLLVLLFDSYISTRRGLLKKKKRKKVKVLE